MVEKFQFNVDSSNMGRADFEITSKNVIIKNVPLTGEIVQPYMDGVAYKPIEEIQKIQVDNIPITFLHPDDSVNKMDSSNAAEETFGFLRKPSLDSKKGLIHVNKLYADMVLFRGSEMVENLIPKLEKGEGVDVSIGFEFLKDESKGTFLSKTYDYIQRAIKLDHLAILMDSLGRIHEGRASFKSGYGIGNDSKYKKMSNDKLIKDHAELGVKYDSLQKDYNELLKAKDEAEEKVETLESEKKEVEEKVETLETEKKEVSDKLNVYLKSEKDAVNSKREELAEKMPAMKEVFTSADDASINKTYEEFSKTKAKKLNIADNVDEEGEGNDKKLTEQEKLEKTMQRKRK